MAIRIDGFVSGSEAIARLTATYGDGLEGMTMHQKMLLIRAIAGAFMMVGSDSEPNICQQVRDDGFPVDETFWQHLCELDTCSAQQCFALLQALTACTAEEFRKTGMDAFFVPQPDIVDWEPDLNYQAV